MPFEGLNKVAQRVRRVNAKEMSVGRERRQAPAQFGANGGLAPTGAAAASWSGTGQAWRAAFPATLSQAAEALVSGARIDAGARQRKVVLDGIVGRIEPEGFGDTKGGTQVDAGAGPA